MRSSVSRRSRTQPSSPPGSRRPACSASTLRRRGAIAVDADLAIVNRFELESLARTGRARGAHPRRRGRGPARGRRGDRPRDATAVDVVDGTAAGDAFTACLVVSLLEGRDNDEALQAGVRGRRPRGLASRRATLAADGRRDRRDTARMSIDTSTRATNDGDRSSSTATQGTTTRSPCCSRSRARRSSCSG